MSTARLMQMGAAGEGNHPRPVTDVEDVFSTYLYEGVPSTGTTVVNGIDLAGEGGMVWVKSRESTSLHLIYDTDRGAGLAISSNNTDAESSQSDGPSAFNDDGFDTGSSPSQDFASWTFRKAPKFFTCLTYTGDGTQNRQISHNLGSVPGSIIVKATSASQPWYVYHRSCSDDNASWCKSLTLNSTAAEAGSGIFAPHADQTSTHFKFYDGGNTNGVTYVAYLFAHNDGDGEFGPDGDADIIKCGSFTTDGSGNATVDLGWEPQWALVKPSSAAGNWRLIDNMRGWVNGGTNNRLFADSSGAESAFDDGNPTATGFQMKSAGASITYIYIAIRRGTKVPESGTEVFHTQLQSNGDTYSVGFPNDLLLLNKTGGSSANTYVGSRLTGDDKYLVTSSKAAEGTSSGLWSFDLQDSFDQGASTASPWVGYHWKRAPGYFNVVAYSGNGTAGRTVSHNLTVAPEMMWVKGRDLDSQDWAVYHSALGTSKYIKLNEAAASIAAGRITGTSETTFTLDSDDIVNKSNDPYIAYLFASLDGISKVGSYTGNGSSQTIDCGFSSGARFILVKRTDSTGDWYVWDTERGIVTGNDPFLELNTTDAEVTSDDSVDPDATGFIVNQTATTNINVSSAEYIFYAIA